MSVEAEHTEADDRVTRADVDAHSEDAMWAPLVAAIPAYLLIALARAEASVKGCPEPKCGRGFEARWRRWQTVYRQAVEFGAALAARGDR